MSSNNKPNNTQSNETQGSDIDIFLKQLFGWCCGQHQRLKSWFHFDFSFFKLVPKLLGVVLALWLISGVYIVDQGNQGVVSRFGAYAEITDPGPHWHWPYPIETVTKVNVDKQRYIEIGYRSNSRSRGRTADSVLPESLMLTGDENIVSVRMAVQYQVKDAHDYLFKLKNPEATLKQVTESVQRGVVGKSTMDYILTDGRSQVVADIKSQIQTAMDQYQAGVMITSVNLQDAQPPEQVQQAFEDAIRAREDKQRLINKAESYANEVIPKARGEASRLLQDALGYEAQIIAKATGEAERFERMRVEYEKAPNVTHKRLYLEAKEKLFRNTNKVLVNLESGNNMLYLPVPQGNQSNAATSMQMPPPKAPVAEQNKTNNNTRTSTRGRVRSQS